MNGFNGNNSSNKLINNYNNYQQQQNRPVGYQNNNLLMNNPMLQQQQYMQQQQMQQQNQYMQQMQQIQQMQRMKQMEKLNEIDVSMDKEKIKESLIKPIKIEKSKQEKAELEKKWKETENNYYDNSGKGKDFGTEVKQYWAKRTNQPYKNIMKNEDYTKKISSDKDLIVHRVTNKDKEGVEEGFLDLQDKLEKHNDELKVIYSVSKKNEHKKKFEYNHVYKYRVQHEGKDHDEMKDDRIKYYKAQQKKEEAGKKKLDILLDTLVSDGIFDKDDLSGISLDKNKYNSDNDNSSSSTNSKKDKYLERKNKK